MSKMLTLKTTTSPEVLPEDEVSQIVTADGLVDRIEPKMLNSFVSKSGTYKTFTTTGIPDSVDWRTSGAVTEIQD